MKQFIGLHDSEDNTIIVLNISRIITAAWDPENKTTTVYIQEVDTECYSVNETPAMILKQIGDSRKFIMVHGKNRNNDVIIPNDLVLKIRYKQSQSMTLITIDNASFADFEVNEKPQSLLEVMNG